ncbi:hypothetical protein TrLO_g8048 [Triparma laevis f. longispina]|uniref:Plastid lipid-associated protein/fibrillin conserved domain-containing protein n=1 Tax=Triparma laevis f. longispina TaxID=1714387 RepID=A0A9W7FA28_9STRA|nr:hypothetical protein TrLO_g8048 [Triparma laevis f. longispina]
MSIFLQLITLLALVMFANTFQFNLNLALNHRGGLQSQRLHSSLATETTTTSLDELKFKIVQLGAALDRGQAYNPTSGSYYSGTMAEAKTLIESLPSKPPTSISDMDGEWELVLSTVPHGIFRSSPFFMAIQDAFSYAENTTAFGEDKANLFFKLHELQTCSWGVSKVGRVAQRFDSTTSVMSSEFDTSIFSLTVIPILGWFKLLPTFGGCVVTVSKYTLSDDMSDVEFTVDYTTSRPVEGLQGLGEWIWKVKVPVGAVWRLLPWNKGREAKGSVKNVFCDEQFRVVQDTDGEFFVYTRPVVPRPLEL